LRYVFSRSLFILIAALASTGCVCGTRILEKRSGTEVALVAEMTPRQCFRNEYPFEDQPDQKDVQSLTVYIDGDRVTGEYNWLPAFKDKRTGRFAGTIDGQLIMASYEYTQEGLSAIVAIEIALGSDQAVVKGGGPELGLGAMIARVDC